MNAAAAAVVVLNGRQAFDPRATLFAHNEPGAWYDPSDLGTMFTTSDGTTPVTGVEQAVGLILDKSRGLAVGGELVTNGSNLVNTTGWTATGSATLAAVGGALQLTTLNAYEQARQTITTVAGKTYKVTFTTGTPPSDFVYVTFAGISSAFITTAGTYSFVGTATSTGTLLSLIFADGVGIVVFSNISVREIAGTHAIQATAASRPVLRNRYNQIVQSENLSNVAWAKSDVTVTGTTTVVETATTQPHYVEPVTSITLQNATTYRVYCSAKAGAQTYIFIGMARASSSAAASTEIDLTTGAESRNYLSGTGWAIGTPVISAVDANGFRSIYVDITVGTSSTSESRVFIGLSDGSGSFDGRGRPVYLGATNKSADITQVDIRLIPDTIYPYQRIESATVYDSDASKFPLYLAFDGSDDSLYTAANLDLSSTDKVTVFAGVTKLSDAAAGILAELSSTDANAGSFGLQAPNSATNSYRFITGGSSPGISASATGFPAPATSVVTGIGDIAADTCIIRVNGAQAASSASDQGTGNFGAYPLYIGRRNNASLPFNGRIQQLIVRGAASSAAEIASTERWIAGKQGRSL